MADRNYTIDLDELNDSELVQLAKLNQIPGISRALPREDILYCLQNLVDTGMSSPMEGYAQKMSQWLTVWWDRLRGIAPKKVCPNCTKECSDLQVLDCYEANKANMGSNARLDS